MEKEIKFLDNPKMLRYLEKHEEYFIVLPSNLTDGSVILYDKQTNTIFKKYPNIMNIYMYKWSIVK